MEPIKKLDKNRMRQNNVRLIYETIYRTKGISRAQLAAKTKMSAMNVGRIVDFLCERGLIEERDGADAAVPGRPARRLHVRANGVLSLGVSLDVWGVFIGLVDACGRIMAHNHTRFSQKTLPAVETLQTVAGLIEEFSALHGLAPDTPVGMVLPGVLDPKTGIVKVSSQLGWNDVPVAGLLQEYTGGRTILLDNDVKARAQAESRFGAARKYTNCVLMTIGSGIGAGIIIEGKIYRGKDNMAGEIGHIAVNPTLRLCECGRVGCLQATVTEAAILQEARAIRPDIDMPGVAAAYQAGEGWARALLDIAAGTILTTINLLANSFASEAIVLCGSFIDNYPVFRTLIEDAYKKQHSTFLNTNFDLVFSNFGPDGNVIGAATVALNHNIRRLVALPAAS